MPFVESWSDEEKDDRRDEGWKGGQVIAKYRCGTLSRDIIAYF